MKVGPGSEARRRCKIPFPSPLLASSLFEPSPWTFPPYAQASSFGLVSWLLASVAPTLFLEQVSLQLLKFQLFSPRPISPRLISPELVFSSIDFS